MMSDRPGGWERANRGPERFLSKHTGMKHGKERVKNKVQHSITCTWFLVDLWQQQLGVMSINMVKREALYSRDSKEGCSFLAPFSVDELPILHNGR